jgi:mono/diheme cytochrome c family protein
MNSSGQYGPNRLKYMLIGGGGEMAMQAKARNYLLMAFVAVAAGLLYFGQIYFGPKPVDGSQSVSNPVPNGFVVPQFNDLQARGEQAFIKSCQACHGQNALGSDKGPTFLSKLYSPNIHGDGAFIFAASQGSQQHHWNFGNMPSVEGVTTSDVEAIIAYVRALQEANSDLLAQQ